MPLILSIITRSIEPICCLSEPDLVAADQISCPAFFVGHLSQQFNPRRFHSFLSNLTPARKPAVADAQTPSTSPLTKTPLARQFVTPMTLLCIPAASLLELAASRYSAELTPERVTDPFFEPDW